MATLRQWNDQFQKLVDGITDDFILEQEREFTELAQLAKDFVHTATTIGKIIIQERHLPLSLKTIEPKQMGGQAGGQKFISHNIMWKFAVDSHHGFFGSDEFAAKACSHELLGLSNIYQFGSDTGVHVPLCCLIDYLGYRLIAMSFLPIDKTTLVAGSGDCGRTILNKSPEMQQKLERLATRLNLKRHYVTTTGGERSPPLHTCFDLEGHKGKDGRYYVIDCARLFPCEPPDKRHRNGHLYRMLRPELVRSNSVPLSSDVYLKLARSDKESMKEVSMTYKRLRTEVIPRFALWLDRQALQKARSNGRRGRSEGRDSGQYIQREKGLEKRERSRHGLNLERVSELPLSVYESEDSVVEPELIRENLSAYLHRAGINMRHLGLVRRHTKSEYWRGALLVEAVCRTLKQLLRHRYRSVMRRANGLSLEPFRIETAQFLNAWFGNTSRSNRLWAALHGEIKRRFQGIFDSQVWNTNPFHKVRSRGNSARYSSGTRGGESKDNRHWRTIRSNTRSEYSSSGSSSGNRILKQHLEKTSRPGSDQKHHSSMRALLHRQQSHHDSHSQYHRHLQQKHQEILSKRMFYDSEMAVHDAMFLPDDSTSRRILDGYIGTDLHERESPAASTAPANGSPGEKNSLNKDKNNNPRAYVRPELPKCLSEIYTRQEDEKNSRMWFSPDPPRFSRFLSSPELSHLTSGDRKRGYDYYLDRNSRGHVKDSGKGRVDGVRGEEKESQGGEEKGEIKDHFPPLQSLQGDTGRAASSKQAAGAWGPNKKNTKGRAGEQKNRKEKRRNETGGAEPDANCSNVSPSGTMRRRRLAKDFGLKQGESRKQFTLKDVFLKFLRLSCIKLEPSLIKTLVEGDDGNSDSKKEVDDEDDGDHDGDVGKDTTDPASKYKFGKATVEDRGSTAQCSVFDFPDPFGVSQVLAINAKVKEMNIANYAQGTALLIRAVRANREQRHPLQLQEARRMAVLAMQRFDANLRLNLTDHLIHCNYGMLISMVFREDRLALRMYQVAHQIDPLHIRTMYYAGISTQRTASKRDAKARAAAESWYNRAIECSKGQHSNVLKSMGFYLSAQGRNAEAQKCFEMAIACNPDHPLPKLTLFSFFLKQIEQTFKGSKKMSPLSSRRHAYHGIFERSNDESGSRSPSKGSASTSFREDKSNSKCGSSDSSRSNMETFLKNADLIVETLTAFGKSPYWRARLSDNDLAQPQLTSIRDGLRFLAFFGQLLEYGGRPREALLWLKKAVSLTESLPHVKQDPAIVITYARLLWKYALKPPSPQEAFAFLLSQTEFTLWVHRSLGNEAMDNKNGYFSDKCDPSAADGIEEKPKDGMKQKVQATNQMQANATNQMQANGTHETGEQKQEDRVKAFANSDQNTKVNNNHMISSYSQLEFTDMGTTCSNSKNQTSANSNASHTPMFPTPASPPQSYVNSSPDPEGSNRTSKTERNLQSSYQTLDAVDIVSERSGTGSSKGYGGSSSSVMNGGSLIDESGANDGSNGGGYGTFHPRDMVQGGKTSNPKPAAGAIISGAATGARFAAPTTSASSSRNPDVHGDDDELDRGTELTTTQNGKEGQEEGRGLEDRAEGGKGNRGREARRHPERRSRSNSTSSNRSLSGAFFVDDVSEDDIWEGEPSTESAPSDSDETAYMQLLTKKGSTNPANKSTAAATTGVNSPATATTTTTTTTASTRARTVQMEPEMKPSLEREEPVRRFQAEMLALLSAENKSKSRDERRVWGGSSGNDGGSAAKSGSAGGKEDDVSGSTATFKKGCDGSGDRGHHSAYEVINARDTAYDIVDDAEEIEIFDPEVESRPKVSEDDLKTRSEEHKTLNEDKGSRPSGAELKDLYRDQALQGWFRKAENSKANNFVKHRLSGLQHGFGAKNRPRVRHFPISALKPHKKSSQSEKKATKDSSRDSELNPSKSSKEPPQMPRPTGKRTARGRAFEVGNYVTSRYSADQQWYAAQVKQVYGGGDSYLVQYLEYDTSEIRQRSQLRKSSRKRRNSCRTPSTSLSSSKSSQQSGHQDQEHQPDTEPRQQQSPLIQPSKMPPPLEQRCAECKETGLPLGPESGKQETEARYCICCWERFLKQNGTLEGKYPECWRCRSKKIPIATYSEDLRSPGPREKMSEDIGKKTDLTWCVVCWSRVSSKHLSFEKKVDEAKNSSKKAQQRGGDLKIDWREAHAFMHGYLGRRGIRESATAHWDYMALSFCYAEFLTFTLCNLNLAEEYWNLVEMRDRFNLAVYRVQGIFWANVNELEKAHQAFIRGFRTIDLCTHMWLGELPVTRRFLRSFKRLYLSRRGLHSRRNLPLNFRRERYLLLVACANVLESCLKRIKVGVDAKAGNRASQEAGEELSMMQKSKVTELGAIINVINDWKKKQPPESRGWGVGKTRESEHAGIARRKGFVVPGCQADGFAPTAEYNRIDMLARMSITRPYTSRNQPFFSMPWRKHRKARKRSGAATNQPSITSPRNRG
eukprot:CAMPEP_0184483924 /NCGR_PEP_ID=MMETSP0113_2-20130426/5603_1 /TAXON_ID=91329 /ORGANISM="Norrisiella sphaerica, Strain BC52" /LENGTH=2464 /DNA_ID=CAMNT_0026864607 /DNA_START=62 /DNA_END=7456 /DNA_ORIENTATION=+